MSGKMSCRFAKIVILEHNLLRSSDSETTCRAGMHQTPTAAPVTASAAATEFFLWDPGTVLLIVPFLKSGIHARIRILEHNFLRSSVGAMPTAAATAIETFVFWIAGDLNGTDGTWDLGSIMYPGRNLGYVPAITSRAGRNGSIMPYLVLAI